MRHDTSRISAPRAVLVLWAALAPAVGAAPAGTPVAPAAPPSAPPSGGGHHYHHYHHHGHFRHYGHFRHGDSGASSPVGGDNGDDQSAGKQSFERDGRRYYWHTRNGHRFYSSRPEPGDGTGPDLGGGEDLDAPLSREERAQRAARMQHAQAHLAAVERRVARQRHQVRLQLLEAKPKLPLKRPRH